MAGKMPNHIGGYQIQKELGKGAFGRVYQAYDARVNRLVAIKVLLLTDKEVITRFKNEANVAGNLRHNNIVTIYEFGEHEGLPFLVMEFLDGENLQDVIRTKKPLTLLQKISIMTQMAEGLDCAHRHGVVHRDVKPANMMLLPDGTVKIMDFGIARLTGDQQATRLTQQGDVLGTLLYMAPEQFAKNTEVDALCDIFACGEVFYELLAGRHPFDADEPRILLYKVTVEDPPPLRNFAPDCPGALDLVLARMLSKPRDLRYHSLREVLFDIQPVLFDLQQARAATLMTEALDLFRQQKADAANALLPEILELDPGNRSAYRLRDQVQRELLKPKIEALLKTGREELAMRRYSEAIQAFSAASRLDNSNSQIHDLLGQAKAAQEQSQRASQLVTEARVALDQQNLTGAYKNVSEALLVDPENPQASRLLLVIQSAIDRKRQQQLLDGALLKAEHLLMIQAYDKALEALSGVAAAADERVVHLGSRIRALKHEHERAERLADGMAAATEMLRELKLDEAVRQLTALFSEFPDKLDVRQLLQYALKEQAAQQRAQAIEKIKADSKALADAHDFRGALETLEEGLQTYDDGSLVRLLGTIMAAKAAWEREVALKAARARCERLRGDGRLTEAIQAAESALRSHPDPAMTEMLRELERAWEQAKRDEEIRATVSQARSLLESGEPEKALRFLPNAARRFPESAELQAVLAEAKQAFEAEVRQREVETVTRDARTEADRANFDAALGALDRGIEEYPDEPTLRTLREEIVQHRAVALRRQDVQRAMQEGNRLAAVGRYAEALESVREALGRYEDETALVQAERQLQTDWERRQRELAIMQAATMGHTLLEHGKAAEAVELLRGALKEYPAERDLELMLARAQRAAAIDQVIQEARAFMAQRDFDAALKMIEQGLRSWTGERSLAALQNEAAAGLAVLRREQSVRDTIERSRALAAEGRPVDALRLVDAAMRQYPGETALVEARQEAERARRRAADLDALRCLEGDTRAIADAAEICYVAEKVRAIVQAYAGDVEMEAAAARTLDLLGRMQDASAVLARRDFGALQAACEGLRADYPQHVLFQRLETEAARGLRQAAVQELRQKVQNELDLEAKGKLLGEALPLYPDEAWLEQEAHVVLGKLGLVGTIVEKARAAAQAERWDEAIEQWTSLRGIYPNYSGLDSELDAARANYVEQIRQRMSVCDYIAAAHAAQRAPREITADAELQALREQIHFAQSAVQDARVAVARQAFGQASRTLEAALSRYAEDPLLQREAEAVARLAAERETAINEVVRRADQQQSEETLQAAEAAIAQYGEDSRLLDLRRRLQSLRQAREVRSGDLLALGKLQDDARALTSSAAIAGLRQKVHSIASRYAADAEFAQTAAAVEQQLDALQQAGELLARREYGAVLEICGRYPEHRLLQSLKGEAARGEHAARVAEVERQVDEEPDLRRQAELLEVALRSLTEEASLRERSRAVKQKLDEADTAARNAQQAEQQSRWDDAIDQWNRVGELYQAYPRLKVEIARVEEQRRRARAAERDRLVDQIRRRVQSGDYDKANSLAELARKQLPGDAEIEELDALVQAKREAARQAREAQLRADSIRQAAEQIEALCAQGRASEALKMAEASLRQYPGEAPLVQVQEKVRLAQAEALRQQQRKQDMAALRRLDVDAHALTDVARVAAMQRQVRSIAVPHAADEEISRLAADLDRRLSAMTDAKALLDRQDFAATLQACGEYPDHQFFARLKADAERAERAARVAEVERQVSIEPDLMRQLELLDSTLRLYPDDAKLLERSRVVRTKIGQVDTIVQQARQAEQSGRWDEALQQWAALGGIYKEYPGRTQEVERVRRLKREQLGDEIWQRVNTGDYDAAAGLLDRAREEFPEDAELQFLREQVEAVREIVRQARALAPAQGVATVEAALGKYPGDKLLERELPELRQRAVHESEVRDVQARVRRLASDGNHEAILQLVRESSPHVRQDTEIRELSAAAAEILAQREVLGQARDLGQQGRFAEARQLLDRAAHEHPGAAQEIARARTEIAAAEAQQQTAAQMAQLTAEVERLCARKKYNAALRTIAVSDVSGPAVAELRQRVQTLAAGSPEPRIPKIAWISGGAAVLALVAWGISTLIHRDGTVIVKTTPAASVSVDKSSGTAADDKGIVTLHTPAGSHTLTISKPGFQTAEQPLEVKSGATYRVAIALTAGKNVLTATPIIASLDPGSVVNLGAAFTLTVSGSGFETGTTVKWNGAALHTTHVRNTQLRAAVPANLVEKPGKAVITAANGNVSSALVTLPINPSAPAIASLQPAAVNAEGAGFVLRVSGTGFQPGATVDWGSTHLSPIVEGATSIRVPVPAKLIAKSGSVAVTVRNPGDVASSAVTFIVNSLAPAPTVSGLNPSTVTAGGAAFTLTVSGSNFVPGASVRWNGSPLATTVAGPSQLSVQVPANLIANAGNVSLMVVNPGNVSSPEMNLSIAAPMPTPAINSVSPSSGTVGSAVNLTINGSNFQAGATVEWNRSPVQTNFTSPSQLRTTIPANLLTGAGIASIVVMNPGNVASASASFTINPPAAVPPAITGLNPTTTAAGGQQLTLIVSGTGFAQGASVHWNRAPLSIVSSNAAQLRATVPANLIGAAGTASVTVVNPDGAASGAVTFTITAPAVVPPVISGLSPSSTPAGGAAFTLTINGSGFQPGATVQWNRSAITTNFNGPGQVTARVGANLIAAQGSAAITVVNPGNVTSTPSTFSILPPQISQSNLDAEPVKSVLAQYAAAYSQKNFRKVIALFPLMPRGNRRNLQDAFSRSDYIVQYTIEVTAPPVIRGDDASVNARTVILTTFAGRASAPVTKDVVITLHRGGGQWTITGFR